MKKTWRILAFPALVLTLLGAVIWAKLRLVGGIPRTVYAQPEPGAARGAPPAAGEPRQPGSR
jgi:hypothetical protein